MITFACAGCGRTLNVKDTAAGKKARCPACDHSTTVPEPPIEAATMPPDPDATILPDPARPAAGRACPAGYEMLEELGRGGMGVVYKARQVKANRLVALKMILAGAHADDAERDRFGREALAIASLQHPNIVQVFEVGEHDGLPFFSLELCPGGSLEKKLRGTPQPPRQAAELVRAVAAGVQAAHEANVIHRDLKPANVLLAANGAPKVTDFGLAKKLDDASGQTRTGVVMGTPSYMAPEQAQGKKDVGPAADVWALGAILYECLTGRPPFRAATSLDTILQVLSDDPVPPAQLNGQVPRDLDTICLKCLKKAPADRYATAKELADDLGRWLADEPIRARRVGALRLAAQWLGRQRVAAGLVAAALLVAGALGAAGYFWVLVRKADEEKRRAADAKEEAEAQRLIKAFSAKEAPLAATEEDALWALVDLRSEGTRRHFLRLAGEDPHDALRVALRNGLVMRAVVGLDRDRRRQAIEMFKGRLADANVDPELKAPLALLGVALAPDDPAALQALLAALPGQGMPFTAAPLPWLCVKEGLLDVPAERMADLTGSRAFSRLAPVSAAVDEALSSAPAEKAWPALRALIATILMRLEQEQRPEMLHVDSSVAPGKHLVVISKRVPAAEAARAAEALTEALEKTSDWSARAELAEALREVSRHLSDEQATRLAGRVARAVLGAPGKKGPTPPRQFATACAAVADRLPPDLADAVARAVLTKIENRGSSPGHTLALARACRRLPAERAHGYAHRAATALHAAIPKPAKAGDLARFGEGLDFVRTSYLVQTYPAALLPLADLLPADDAAVAVWSMLDGPDPGMLLYYGEPATFASVEALAGRLSASAAERSAQRLLVNFGQPTELEKQMGVSLRREPQTAKMKGLSALCARLPADRAARYIGQAGAVLRANKAPLEGANRSGEAWQALVSRLSGEQAEAVARALLGAMKNEPALSQLGALGESVGAVCKRMAKDRGERTAEQAAGLLLDALAKAASKEDCGPVVRGLQALPGRRPPGPAGRAARAVVAALRERKPFATTSAWPAVLGHGLLAAAKDLPADEARALAEQAVPRLAPRLAKTDLATPSYTAPPAEGLAAVCALLPADRAREEADRASRALLARLATAASAPEATPLAKAVFALGKFLPPPTAAEYTARAADHVARLALARGSSAPQAGAASVVLSLGEMANRVGPEQADRIVQESVYLAAKGLERGGPPLFQAPPRANQPIPLLRTVVPRASTQGLADALKSPFCLAPARRLLLAELGRRAGRPFATVWAFADWAADHARDIDLRRPPPRPAG